MMNIEECLQDMINYHEDGGKQMDEVILQPCLENGVLTKFELDIVKEKFEQYKLSCQASLLEAVKPETNFVKEKTVPFKVEMKKLSGTGLNGYAKKEYVIKRFGITNTTLATVCAAGGSGKSMFLQYLAVCVNSGKNIFGEFETEKGDIIHIDAEQSEDQTMTRYERISAGLGVTDFEVARMTLTSPLDSSKYIETIEKDLCEVLVGKKLAIIDSLKAITEADENGAEISKILKIFKRVAEKTRCAVLVIHHKGKTTTGASQTGRGHSSIYDSVDVQIDLDCADTDTQIFELKCAKNRDGRRFDGVSYTYEDSGEFNENQNCSEKLEFKILNSTVKSIKVNVKQVILKSLNDTKMKKGELYDLIKGDSNVFNKAFDALLTEEMIKITVGAHNAKVTELTEKGKKSLDWPDEIVKN